MRALHPFADPERTRTKSPTLNGAPFRRAWWRYKGCSTIADRMRAMRSAVRTTAQESDTNPMTSLQSLRFCGRRDLVETRNQIAAPKAAENHSFAGQSLATSCRTIRIISDTAPPNGYYGVADKPTGIRTSPASYQLK